MTKQEMKEYVANAFMRQDGIEEVKTDGDEILIRKYAHNDFIRVGQVKRLYNRIMGDVR